MDRLLKPERFTTEPNEPEAEKRYKHWKATLQNYLASTLTAPADDDQAALATHNRKKLYALQNNVSHAIFELISDSNDYATSIQTLDNAYIKPRSIIYNRHKLMTSRQEPLQSIDTFLQSLEKLSKTCNFEAVTAENYRKQYVRDAFINGISAAHIRQRLLENNELTLDAAHQQARSLEQAQSQAASYENSIVGALNSVESQPAQHQLHSQQQLQQHLQSLQQQQQQHPDPTLAAVNENNTQKCFFCGKKRHPRSRCPARNSTCQNCGKKGHWMVVCNSPPLNPQASALGAMSTPSNDLPHLT